MAFGKNPDQLNSVGTYGQASLGQQAGATARRGRGGSKKRRPYWAGNYDISDNPQKPSRVRFLRGDYKQQVLVQDSADSNVLLDDSFSYVMFRDHYHYGKKRGAICSAGPYYMDRDNRLACNGCDFFWSEQDAVNEAKARGVVHKRAMSMHDQFVFSLFDYGFHFDLPQTGKDGQFRMNPRTQKPYTEWVKADNPHDPAYAGHPWKEGHTWAWQIGKQYREILLSWQDVVGVHCTSCGNVNCVTSVGHYCANPQCRQLALDPNSVMSDEQRKEMTSGLHQCAHCKQNTYLEEFVQCSHCTVGKRATIFDVDMFMYKLRSGDNKTQLVIMSTGAPGPITTQDPAASADIKPLDLMKKFAPSDLDEQYEQWGDPPSAVLPQQPQQAPQMPQPITGAPMPPPQPTVPAVGMPPQAPAQDAYGQEQPPQLQAAPQQTAAPAVDVNAMNAGLQALMPNNGPQG